MSAPPQDSEEMELGSLGAMAERCRGLIRTTTDWPRVGTNFLDMSPLFCDAAALRSVVYALAERYRTADVTHFAGVDARGFGLACALAFELKCAFLMVRKQGKLPTHYDNSSARLLSNKYNLEYGDDALEIASDILDGAAVNKVVVVDDVAATGGTAIAAANLLRDAGAVIHEVAVVAELVGKLNPRQRIKNEAFVRLHSLLVYEA